MRRGHRFLAYSLGAVAAASAAGRLVARRDGRRGDPAADEPLGAIRGQPEWLEGPGGTRLYSERFPAGGRRAGTVVLTHGWCMTESAWHYQKRDLTGGPLALVTWDLPGHGHSQPLARGHLTLDQAVDALAAVIDGQGPGRLVLVGHSFGGVVTIRYAALHAETARRKLAGVVLVSTPMMHVARSVAGRWPGARLEARALAAVMERVVESGLTERVLWRDVGMPGVSRLSYRIVRVGFGMQPSPSHVRFMRDVIASVPPQVRADTFRTMRGYDAGPDLARIPVPALVVAGALDRLVSPAEALAIAARLPAGRHVVLPGVGHAPFLEAHEEFDAALRRFLDERLPSLRRKAAR